MNTLLWLVSVALASTMTGSPGDATLQLNHDGQDAKLSLAGQGLRKKKVAMFKVKVYDASLYVSDAAAFQRTDAQALDSATQQKAIAIRLKFLRDVDSARIVASYKEALEANKVDLLQPSMKDFLAAVEKAGEVKEGQWTSLVGLRTATGETILLEKADRQIVALKGPSGYIKQIFSIWLGKMSEDTMTDLKTELLKKP